MSMIFNRLVGWGTPGIVVAICGLLATPLPAESGGQDIHSANYWQQRCTGASREDARAVGDCLSFVFAMNEFNRLLPALGHSRAYCPPEGVTAGQVHALVVKKLRDHPEHWERPFIAFVVVSLAEVWPCPR